MKISQKAKAIISLVIATLLLEGCGGVEPEKRDYPLALAWDYEDSEYKVIYGMADLQEMTKQKKDGEDTPAGLEIRGKSMNEIQEGYAKTQQYYLDLGHVKAVIFSERLLDQPRAYQQIVEGMQESPEVGKNAYVFMTDSLEEVMKAGVQEEDSLGEYLTGIYENQMNVRKDGVTLEDIYYDWNNEGRITKPPQLKVEEGQVVLCENL